MTVHPHDLSGAYALDALPPDDHAEYEAHLNRCDDCTEEVAGFQATATRLGSASETAVPPNLRPRVLDEVARTPQERPAVAAVIPPSRIRRIAARTALAAAAAAVAVSVGWSIAEHGHNEELTSRQAAVAEVLTAQDAQVTGKRVDGGGSVGVVRSQQLDKAVLVTRDLPELDEKHTYQLWTLTDGEAASAGLLSGKDGTRTRPLTSLAGVGAVAITVEPAGGSDQPTTTPVASVPVA